MDRVGDGARDRDKAVLSQDVPTGGRYSNIFSKFYEQTHIMVDLYDKEKKLNFSGYEGGHFPFA